jgi:sugar phosphate isomerase/epimerase
MIKHHEHLARYAPRLLGFHLHDVSSAGKDHQPIGSGSIDFEMISGHWRPEHLLTLELSPRVSAEDVLLSKERVEALVAKRFG